jgi:hypothetical protein
MMKSPLRRGFAEEPCSVGSIEPVGILNGSTMKWRMSNATTIATASDSIVSIAWCQTVLGVWVRTFFAKALAIFRASVLRRSFRAFWSFSISASMWWAVSSLILPR